jgi:hypothetical protein
VWRRRAPRTDRTRAALVLWGGWLVVTAAVFSFGQGIIHTYYTVALAPAIAALVGIGAQMAWSQRHTLTARLVAAATVVISSVWAYQLLDRSPAYHPWLRVVVVVAGVVAALACVLAGPRTRFSRRCALAAAGLALVACLSGPLAYAATTVTTPETGSIPSAGPAVTAGGTGGRFGGFGGGTQAGAGSVFGHSGTSTTDGASGSQPSGTESGASTGGRPSGGPSGASPSGGLSGAAGATGSGGFPGATGATGSGGFSGAAGPTGSGGFSGAAGAGASTTSHALTVALQVRRRQVPLGGGDVRLAECGHVGTGVG